MFSDLDEFKDYLTVQPNVTAGSRAVLVSMVNGLSKRIDRNQDRFDSKLVFDHKISLPQNSRGTFNRAWKQYQEFSRLKGTTLPDVFLDEVPNLPIPVALDARVILQNLGADMDRTLVPKKHQPSPQERISINRIEEYADYVNGGPVSAWRIRSWTAGLDRSRNVKMSPFILNVLETIRLIGGTAFDLDTWILTAGRSYKRLRERRTYEDLETRLCEILTERPAREHPVRDACEVFMRLVPPDIAINRRVVRPAAITEIILPDGSTVPQLTDSNPVEAEENLTPAESPSIVAPTQTPTGAKQSLPAWVTQSPNFNSWRKP